MPTTKLRYRIILPMLVIGTIVANERYDRSTLQDMFESRIERAGAPGNTDPIGIALVWPDDAPVTYKDGVRDAIDGINEEIRERNKERNKEQNKEQKGRKVELKLVSAQLNCENSVAQSQGMAAWDRFGQWLRLTADRIWTTSLTPPRRHCSVRDLAEDTDIFSVIGHNDRDSTVHEHAFDDVVSASLTYQKAGLLFLSPNETEDDLTQHGFDLVFRTTPSDDVYSDRIAKYFEVGLLPCTKSDSPEFSKPSAAPECETLDIAVVYPETSSGRHFVEAFSSALYRANNPRLKLSVQVPYHQDDNGAYADVLRQLRVSTAADHPRGKLDATQDTKFEIDAIVMPGRGHNIPNLIQAIRGFGINAPIVGTHGFERADLLQNAEPEVDCGDGCNWENVYLVSMFDPRGDLAGTDNDLWRFLGRLQVRLLAKAFEQARSRDPRLVALKLTTHGAADIPWAGATGSLANGDSHMGVASIGFDVRGNLRIGPEHLVLKQLIVIEDASKNQLIEFPVVETQIR